MMNKAYAFNMSFSVLTLIDGTKRIQWFQLYVADRASDIKIEITRK